MSSSPSSTRLDASEGAEPTTFNGRSFDARDWARAFVGIVRENPEIATDESAMIGWFANALMRGYDEHAHRCRIGIAPPPAASSSSVREDGSDDRLYDRVARLYDRVARLHEYETVLLDDILSGLREPLTLADARKLRDRLTLRANDLHRAAALSRSREASPPTGQSLHLLAQEFDEGRWVDAGSTQALAPTPSQWAAELRTVANTMEALQPARDASGQIPDAPTFTGTRLEPCRLCGQDFSAHTGSHLTCPAAGNEGER